KRLTENLSVKLLVIAVLTLFSCDASRPKAFITPRVTFNKSSAEMGTPVEVTYSFQTSSDFPGLKKDLIVFVHFLDPSHRIRFVDDHNPPIRTNQWGPGRNYSYTRTYFIPENITPGDYVVELGMYTPSGKGERFVLNAKQISDRSYQVGGLNIQKPSKDSEPEFVSGWYDFERDPNDDWYHWRWMSKSAIARLPNPHSNALLYLKAESERYRFQEPQRITIFLKERQIDQFEVESSGTFVKKFEIPANLLGSEKTVDVKLEVNQTFSPSVDKKAGDTRELGLRVYCLYLGVK
ncbi:MAG TPA: hypothetical protein VLH08_20215, partial [Acidobacteriota bacterium]|nr:hypothetical protein [Acidobacteriota bacterium]